MRSFSTLLLLGALAFVLFLTNPEPDDFRVFAREQSEDLFRREVGTDFGDGALGQALGDLASSVAVAAIDRVTERTDYVVASVYTLDLDGAGSTDNEWRFLGIAGQFVELHRPVALEEESAP